MTKRLSFQQAEVAIDTDGVTLEGFLEIPHAARGVVAFAHGSGSSRFSPRNRFVADSLGEADLATLLFDLLTPEEQRLDEWTGHLRFNIDLLSRRLTGAIDWLSRDSWTHELPIGLFGASTGAAAALVAATRRPNEIQAVVSRGGRPDLAGAALAQVTAPVLLIVGGDDEPVIELNRKASRTLRAPHGIEIVPGASHLFEEPGTLEEVARVARDWFQVHLVGHQQPS